jgi:hypothetical protein
MHELPLRRGSSGGCQGMQEISMRQAGRGVRIGRYRREVAGSTKAGAAGAGDRGATVHLYTILLLRLLSCGPVVSCVLYTHTMSRLLLIADLLILFLLILFLLIADC